ncbi:hypothetical protein [Egicoccus halophilus]|uniref:Uncharacterized protein n=1 Tax=Egicoccus halophilus TaxID=1670830 RepID=A0A8J3ESG4_9ACTN|nr:hypothetical protein [Egicoccus halophilus]GGI03221.1 hypothetical protein GCM10011354_03030 [Egicoccus halophilus]
MAFLDPKQKQDEHDDVLPGAPGLHLDLDVRVCPRCRAQVPPWQPRCRDCDVATVAPEDVPATSFALPAFEDDDEADRG